MKIYSIAFLFMITAISSGSCDRRPQTVKQNAKKNIPVSKSTSVTAPENNSVFVTGDKIQVSIASPDSLVPDSIEIFFRGMSEGIFSYTDQIYVNTVGANPGKAGIRAKVYLNDTLSEMHSLQVELYSEVVPVNYRYRVVNTYDHDDKAYTQGLIYYDGWLYEGTGNYNQSTVRKVRLENGEVIQARNNASDVFGEGITIFNNKIYQLTYRSQICFVYDLNTFDEIKKFYFQNKEGWGLTNDEDELIMSDGTNIIYFLDPEMFTVNRQIEVYNPEGPVMDLNELEYINGKIYANRYYTDEIVIIDPVTGKEEGRVDMKGILQLKDRKPSTNVLNGIAWDDQGKRMFITGKYWPKLFEIELIPLAGE